MHDALQNNSNFLYTCIQT